MAEKVSFSRADAVAFDRHAMETLGVPGAVLMENAAIGCMAALRELAGNAWPRVRVEIVCGPGNNGGDGYAIARHCLLEGATPRVRPFGAPRAGSDADLNARICCALGIPSVPLTGASVPSTSANVPLTSARDEPLGGDLIVDALFGTGLDRPVDSAAARVIDAINLFKGRILSVDLPSGLDADTGQPLGHAVRATITATMVALKRGFSAPGAHEWTGRVIVVPIGVPAPDSSLR